MKNSGMNMVNRESRRNIIKNIGFYKNKLRLLLPELYFYLNHQY